MSRLRWLRPVLRTRTTPTTPTHRRTRPLGRPFTVTLARSSRAVDVRDDHTIVEALEANGITVPAQCRFGVCGTCQTALLEGDVDHRDFCLDADSRRHSIILCVSRSASGAPLVLDL